MMRNEELRPRFIKIANVSNENANDLKVLLLLTAQCVTTSNGK